VVSFHHSHHHDQEISSPPNWKQESLHVPMMPGPVFQQQRNLMISIWLMMYDGWTVRGWAYLRYIVVVWRIYDLRDSNTALVRL
jgi:hypothetical protein